MIPELEGARCGLCNTADAKVIYAYHKPDPYEAAAGVTADGYFRYWLECQACGLHYSLHARSPEDMDKLYSSSYRSSSASWRRGTAEKIFERVIALPEEESETKYRVKWIKNNIAEFRRSAIMAHHAPPYRLLDVGGATGVFAYEFQDDEWKSFVVDPDETGAFLEKRTNIRFIPQKYAPGLFGGSFDLVSLVFVLEHMPDPGGILRALHQDLSKHGLIYIEVPSDLAFRYKPAEDDIFNSCHLWMFGTETLVRLLSSCGFEVLALHSVCTRRGYFSLMALARPK